MARVLVVEQREPPMAAALLESEGFGVAVAVHVREAVAVLADFQPDLVLVEVDAPRSEAVKLCTTVRAASALPIAMLSGPCSERDAVNALVSGVDSLMIEPIGKHELVARVRAILRRSPLRVPSPRQVITIGPVVLDVGRREISVFGELVETPRREFDIAEVLMRQAGRVVPRQALVRELWGTARDTKSLDVQVGRLRARLAAAEGRRRIVTIRGVGYRFLQDGDPEFADEVLIELRLPEAAVDPTDRLELTPDPAVAPRALRGRAAT